MALQVWLPFTDGTLKQQGLSSSTVTQTGTINLTNTGKLGKCVTFTTTAGRLNLPTSAMTSFAECSVTLWLNVTAWNTGWDTIFQAGLGSTAWNNYIFGILRNNNSTLACTISNGSTTSSGSYVSSTLSTGTWIHLAFTYSTGKIKIYINGTLDKEYSTSIVPNFAGITYITIGNTNSSSYQCNCKMNDFRIYDHCLSQMEVKELAKGLVLHYPLNRGGWGQENLFLNTGTAVTWSKALNDSGYATNDCFKTQTPVPSLFSVDELITISFDWSTTATGGNFHVECGAVTPWIWGTVVSSKGTRSSASNYIDITSSNQSGHVEITFKITSSQTGAADTLQWLRIRQDGADTANKTFIISSAKLERGSVATPWCPNLSDALGTALNINGTTEYDCSGYGNNGTRTGTFGWTSDTSKYSVSTQFTRGASSLTTPSPSFITEGSVAMWVKVDTLGTSGWLPFSGQDGSYYCLATASGTGNFYNSNIGSGTISYYYDGQRVSAPTGLTTGWHHVVITGINLSSWTMGRLNAYGNQTQTNWNSTVKYSDFRIYATALSASDVKSLYQNSAYIDSSGNVYGAIHMEA